MSTLGNYIHYQYSNYQKHGTTQKGKNNGNGMAILQAQKNAMIAQVRARSKQKNTIQLQQALQGMLYPKTEYDERINTRMQQYLSSSISDILSKWVIQWEGLGVQGTSTKLDSFKFGETEGYHKGNIDKLLAQLSNIKNTLNSNHNLDQNFINQINNLLALASQAQSNAEAFLQQGGGDYVAYAKIGDPVERNNCVNIIKQINNALATISTATYQEAIGTAFEHAIATLDDRLNDTVDATSMRLIKDTIVTGTRADQIQLTGFDTHMKNLSSNFNFSNGEANVRISGQGAIATAGTVFKTDVDLQYNGEKYKISAKNYKLKDTRISLVKNISLLTSLMRSISTDALNHALNMTITHGVDKSVSQRAHEAIKTILAIQALTGLGQMRGAADTLIINNRSAQKVIVKSMRELVTPDLIDRCTFSHYDLDENYNKWMSAKNNANSWLAGKIRIDKMLNSLHQQKLKISLNTKSLFNQ